MLHTTNSMDPLVVETGGVRGRGVEYSNQISIEDPVVHYAISFRSLQGQSLMVGAANVNIELSGDPLFIQEVKRLSHPTPLQRSRRTSVPDAESLRLYNVLRWIKREDKLQSCLSPPSWGDSLSTPTLRATTVQVQGDLGPLSFSDHEAVLPKTVSIVG